MLRFNIYEIKDKSKRVKLILLELENVYSVSSLLTSPQKMGIMVRMVRVGSKDQGTMVHS